MIYLIRIQDAIKIGYSARPRTRIATHQTSNPQAIEVLGIFPGDLAVEAALHQRVAAYRIRGEWFNIPPTLLGELLAQLSAGEYTIGQQDKIPTDKIHKRGYSRRGGWIEYREKNGRRYPRRRSWRQEGGEWRKVFHGRVAYLPTLTEAEYQWQQEQRQVARFIRATGPRRPAQRMSLAELMGE